MVRHAEIEAGEGATLTETIVAAFDGEPAGNVGFVLGFVVGLVAPVGSAEKPVFVDCTAFASDPIPPPHPKPQKVSVIRKMKSRKYGKLCG